MKTIFLKKKSKNIQFKDKKKKNPVSLSKKKYDCKIIESSRVCKAIKGGKKLSQRVIVIVGDKKQRVGVGVGKADTSAIAREKAILNAKKHLITVPSTSTFSIPYFINSSYGACSLLLKPASLGSGIIAGGPVRTVLELGGIQNIVTKAFGAANILNNAKLTILALLSLNEKISLEKAQSLRRLKLYQKRMQK
jgi:small subunit ribosomal protein S5